MQLSAAENTFRSWIVYCLLKGKLFSVLSLYCSLMNGQCRGKCPGWDLVEAESILISRKKIRLIQERQGKYESYLTEDYLVPIQQIVSRFSRDQQAGLIRARIHGLVLRLKTGSGRKRAALSNIDLAAISCLQGQRNIDGKV